MPHTAVAFKAPDILQLQEVSRKKFTPAANPEVKTYYLIRQLPPYWVADIYPIRGKITQSEVLGTLYFEFEKTGYTAKIDSLILAEDIEVAKLVACISNMTLTDQMSRLLEKARRLQFNPDFVEQDPEKKYLSIGAEKALL